MELAADVNRFERRAFNAALYLGGSYSVWEWDGALHVGHTASVPEGASPLYTARATHRLST